MNYDARITVSQRSIADRRCIGLGQILCIQVTHVLAKENVITLYTHVRDLIDTID